jgi:hypothetical protein
MAVAIAMWSWGLLASCAGAEDSAFPPFKTQEIAKDLKIGYAVITADVNGDGKPDIVVVDQHRVIWYENPSWKVHTIISGKSASRQPISMATARSISCWARVGGRPTPRIPAPCNG